MLVSIYRKLSNWKALGLIGSGGTLLGVTPGCDPNVQNAFVAGLAEAAVAAIEEMFTRASGDDSTSLPTVMIDTLQQAMNLLT